MTYDVVRFFEPVPAGPADSRDSRETPEMGVQDGSLQEFLPGPSVAEDTPTATRKRESEAGHGVATLKQNLQDETADMKEELFELMQFKVPANDLNSVEQFVRLLRGTLLVDKESFDPAGLQEITGPEQKVRG